MTTEASSLEESPPSLEEVPPEKGAILELHSIGSEDFDGLLVEYHKIDHETGKYLAVSVDEKQQVMKVKPRCCRRPGIKPLKLRRVLFNIAKNISKDHDRSFDEKVSALQNLIKKDPCCVPAFNCLGFLYQLEFDEWGRDVSIKKGFVEASVSYFRRGLANSYAYETYLTSEYVQFYKRKLSLSLAYSGKANAAIRVNKEASADVSLSAIERGQQAFIAALSKLKRGHNIDYDDGKFARCVATSPTSPEAVTEFQELRKQRSRKHRHYVDFAKHCCGLLELYSNKKEEIEEQCLNSSKICKSAKSLVGDVINIMSVFAIENGRILQLQAEKLDQKEVPDGMDFLKENFDRAVEIETLLFESCTAADGTLLYISEDSKSMLAELRQRLEAQGRIIYPPAPE